MPPRARGTRFSLRNQVPLDTQSILTALAFPILSGGVRPSIERASAAAVRAELASPSRPVAQGEIARLIEENYRTTRRVYREALRPLPYWARIELDNLREPGARPVPFWAHLEQAARIEAEINRAWLRPAPLDPSIKQEGALGPSRTGCYKRPRPHAEACPAPAPAGRAPYAGPSLAAPRKGPPSVRSASRRAVAAYTYRATAANGKLIDVVI